MNISMIVNFLYIKMCKNKNRGLSIIDSPPLYYPTEGVWPLLSFAFRRIL